VPAAVVPNRTALTCRKFLPVNATRVPPAVGPLVGLIALIAGGAT